MGYMAVFPALGGLSVYWSRQSATEADLGARIETFRGALGSDTVGDVIGERVTNAENRFSTAFRLAIASYLVVFVVGVIALFVVPGIVADDYWCTAAATNTSSTITGVAAPAPPVCP